jgi:WD40 repeat protein
MRQTRRIIHRTDVVAIEPIIRFQRLEDDHIVASACDHFRKNLAVLLENGILQLWNVACTPTLQTTFIISEIFSIKEFPEASIIWSSCSKSLLFILKCASKSKLLIWNVENRAFTYELRCGFFFLQC